MPSAKTLPLCTADKLQPSHNEESRADVHASGRTHRRISLPALVVLLLFCFFTPLAILAALRPGSTHSLQTDYTQSCGSSVKEAMARGCTFDVLSYSWTPAACHDNRTAAEFSQWLQDHSRIGGPFSFFRDSDGQSRIMNEEELSALAGSQVFATQEVHLGHCVFSVRRMERILLGVAAASTRGSGLDHTIHCTNHLLEVVSGQSNASSIRPGAVTDIGFNECLGSHHVA